MDSEQVSRRFRRARCRDCRWEAWHGVQTAVASAHQHARQKEHTVVLVYETSEVLNGCRLARSDEEEKDNDE